MCIKQTFRFTCGCVHKNTLRLCEPKLNGRRCRGTTNNGSFPQVTPCSGHQCRRCHIGIKQYTERYCRACIIVIDQSSPSTSSNSSMSR